MNNAGNQDTSFQDQQWQEKEKQMIEVEDLSTEEEVQGFHSSLGEICDNCGKPRIEHNLSVMPNICPGIESMKAHPSFCFRSTNPRTHVSTEKFGELLENHFRQRFAESN